MQLFSHMHAVTDTVTCMRRTDLQNSFSINPGTHTKYTALTKELSVAQINSLELRTPVSVSPLSEQLCDPLMDFNVWATIRPINATAKGHKENESMVIAAARVSAENDAKKSIISVSRSSSVQRCCEIGSQLTALLQTCC